MAIAGETSRNNGIYEVLQEERFICRLKNRFISLIFLSISVALSIWSLYQLFCYFENFLHVPIWASTDFLEVICPRYNPVLHYHQSTFFNCLVKFCWNIHFLTSNIVWKWSLQTITVVSVHQLYHILTSKKHVSLSNTDIVF